MFAVILLFLLLDGLKSSNASAENNPTANCTGITLQGKWNCSKNNDDTFNATFDCDLNKDLSPNKVCLYFDKV